MLKATKQLCTLVREMDEVVLYRFIILNMKPIENNKLLC